MARNKKQSFLGNIVKGCCNIAEAWVYGTEGVKDTAKLARNIVRHSTSWANETMLHAVHDARLARVTSMVKDEYVDSLTEQEQEHYFETGILPPAMEQEAKSKIVETMKKPPTEDDERWEREFLKDK